jgi:carbon starvation protein CstA
MISEEISPLAGVIALVSILAILIILIAVLGLVVSVCAREWWLLLSRRREPVLREEPYVAAVTG